MTPARLVAIRWNGRREPVEVCNRWRVEEAWWREPIARDYFKVVGRALAGARLPRPGRRDVAPRAALRLSGTEGARSREQEWPARTGPMATRRGRRREVEGIPAVSEPANPASG